MGIALPALRVSILEGGLYGKTKEVNVPMGNFLMLLNKRERLFRYLRGIFIGWPVWYIIGLLITFSDEFAKQFGITGFDQPTALMLQYAAPAFGDMSAGLLSNRLKSRKKTLLIYYGITAVFVTLFFLLKGGGATSLYLLCMGLVFGSGLSVLYIAMSAGQCGTNLRATAAISIPNLVCGCLPLILLLFHFPRGKTVFDDYVTAAWVTDLFVMLIGFVSVLYTKESFGKELDFVEEWAVSRWRIQFEVNKHTVIDRVE